MIPTALTIAGSDPSGGAGIQSDLKTFSALQVYGMAVIAALTAQNTTGVSEVLDVPASFVGSQLDAVLNDIPPAAVKTGMLGSSPVVDVVAQRINTHRIRLVVVDPVMVSTSGAALLDANGVESLKRNLMSLAELVTPNLAEASRLSGIEVRNVADMEEAARRIHGLGPRNVLVKGGHLEGDAVDVLFDGRQMRLFRTERIPVSDVHGTGCVLSAAIAGALALGRSLEEAIVLGKDFVTRSIRQSLAVGRGARAANPVAGIVEKES